VCSYSQKEGKIQRQKKAEGPFYKLKIKNVSKQSNTRESNVKLGLKIKEKEEQECKILPMRIMLAVISGPSDLRHSSLKISYVYRVYHYLLNITEE
jgi:hypothetical protein